MGNFGNDIRDSTGTVCRSFWFISFISKLGKTICACQIQIPIWNLYLGPFILSTTEYGLRLVNWSLFKAMKKMLETSLFEWEKEICREKISPEPVLSLNVCCVLERWGRWDDNWLVTWPTCLGQVPGACVLLCGSGLYDTVQSSLILTELACLSHLMHPGLYAGKSQGNVSIFCPCVQRGWS